MFLLQISRLGLVSFWERLFIEKWNPPKLKNVTDMSNVIKEKKRKKKKVTLRLDLGTNFAFAKLGHLKNKKTKNLYYLPLPFFCFLKRYFGTKKEKKTSNKGQCLFQLKLI